LLIIVVVLGKSQFEQVLGMDRTPGPQKYLKKLFWQGRIDQNTHTQEFEPGRIVFQDGSGRVSVYPVLNHPDSSERVNLYAYYFSFFAGIMSLIIASVNSGSNGNCYYVGNQSEAVLIDAGVSCRETEKRLFRMALPVPKIKAMFISHEHTDHTYGMEVFARRYQIPVYISPLTHQNSRLKPEEHLVNPIVADSTIQVGGLVVKAFSKRHDAADPLSFTVSGSGITVGVFTDIGSVCENLVEHFSQCHAAFLEANYDETMLEEGRYPLFLKNRIRGDHGHLSNNQALQLFLSHKPAFMTHLLLSHLSKDNNDPQLVLDLFRQNADGICIDVASRYYESPLFRIDGQKSPDLGEHSPPRVARPFQLRIF